MGVNRKTRPASNTLARFHLQEKLSFIPLHSLARQSFVLSPHTQDTRQYNKMTLKNLPIVAALSLASISTTVLAQAPITIQGGTYDGQAIAGQHVGAAQSYQVALSQRTGSSLSASGDGFTYNLTSKMYMDWSIVSGQSLPCYIIDEDSIGNGTGGPLECGAATNANYPITATLDPQGNVNFDAVESWWVCSVNATSPYGMTKGTVVGGFTSAMPVGAGIADCEAIDGLKIGGGGSSSTTTTTTTKPASSTPVTTTTTGTSTEIDEDGDHDDEWCVDHVGQHACIYSCIFELDTALGIVVGQHQHQHGGRTSNDSFDHDSLSGLVDCACGGHLHWRRFGVEGRIRPGNDCCSWSRDDDLELRLFFSTYIIKLIVNYFNAINGLTMKHPK